MAGPGLVENCKEFDGEENGTSHCCRSRPSPRCDAIWVVRDVALRAPAGEMHRNVLDDVDAVPWGWSSYLAHDFGSSAPSVTYLMARSPGDSIGDRYFPPGSLLILDELATHRPANLNLRMGWTVPQLAETIKGLCRRWDVLAHGVADDAIFARGGHSAGSIADEFRLQGVYFERARKADRVSGWNRMRRLLSHAGAPDRPGLMIARRCRYFWTRCRCWRAIRSALKTSTPPAPTTARTLPCMDACGRSLLGTSSWFGSSGKGERC